MIEPAVTADDESSDPASSNNSDDSSAAGAPSNPFDEGSRNVLPGKTPMTGLEPDVFDEANRVFPEKSQVAKFKKSKDLGTHDQRTRRRLAYSVVALIAVLYIGSFAAFIWGGFDKESFTSLVASISGPQALAAAVIGFYYARGQKEKNT